MLWLCSNRVFDCCHDRAEKSKMMSKAGGVRNLFVVHVCRGLVGQGSETFYCGSEAVQNFLFVAQELRSTEHSPIATVVTVAKANP